GNDLSGTGFPVPTCGRRRASARRVGGVLAGTNLLGTNLLGADGRRSVPGSR
ncbi:MAG: hypothetical protein ACJAZN_003893, partial [Planctomycetota bacterium]